MKDAARQWWREPTAVVRALLLAMIFITPGVFDLGAVKPFDSVKTTTVLFFSWLAFGAWVALVIRGRSRPRRFLMGYLALAFLGANAIAWVFSTTHWTSLFGWYGRYTGLVTILAFVLTFLVVAHVYRERRERVHELLYAIAAGSVVVTLYVLVQRLGIDPIKWAQPSGGTPGQPYFGTMGNANFAGGYIGLTIPWLYYAFRRTKATWQRVALAAWGLVALATLYFTSARNGMVAVAAAVFVFLVIHRRRVPMLLKIGAAVGAVAVVILATVIIVHPGSNKPAKVFRRVDVFRSNTIRTRAYWWQAGVKMFVHRPITGWGPDSFVTHFARYLPRAAAPVGDSETADKPHNVFVEHAAETGILGLGAYLALIVVAFRRGFRRLRDAPPEEHDLIATFLALLGAYLAQAFFSIDVAAIALVGWVTLGAIAALADPPPGAEPVHPTRPRRGSSATVLAAGAMIVAVLLATLSTAPLKADHESKTAQRLANREAPVDEVLMHHERAMSWQPFESLYPGTAGDFLERRAASTDDRREKRDLLTQSVDYYIKMDSLQPGYHLWKYSVGKAMTALAAVGGASFDEAQDWLDEAARLAPYDWRIATARSELFNQWALANAGKPEAARLLCRALDRAEYAVSLRKTRPETETVLGKTLARLGHLDEAVGPLENAIDRKGGSSIAERLLTEVERLQKLPKNKRPVVVNCGS
jgi:O-antigen ligase